MHVPIRFSISHTRYSLQVMTCKEDPMYARFFKMLNFGVPIPAVKAKMEMEGFDGDIIE